MFGKKFFSTMALSGATVSLVGNVGSFAEEKLPSDGGILFKCKTSEVTNLAASDFDSYGIDLQLLVDHFRINREETEKLLKCMRLFLEKYEKLDEFSVDCGDPKDFPEIGQIGFGAKKGRSTRGDYFYFVVRKKTGSYCGQHFLYFTKSELDGMLACNLDNIDFSNSKWYWNIFRF